MISDEAMRDERPRASSSEDGAKGGGSEPEWLRMFLLIGGAREDGTEASAAVEMAYGLLELHSPRPHRDSTSPEADSPLRCLRCAPTAPWPCAPAIEAAEFISKRRHGKDDGQPRWLELTAPIPHSGPGIQVYLGEDDRPRDQPVTLFLVTSPTWETATGAPIDRPTPGTGP
jgi:hypothetical protein